MPLLTRLHHRVRHFVKTGRLSKQAARGEETTWLESEHEADEGAAHGSLTSSLLPSSGGTHTIAQVRYTPYEHYVLSQTLNIAYR